MKTRDLQKALRSLGCAIVRTRGSHEIWVSPSGQKLPPVVVTQREASRRVLTTIKRALRSEGLAESLAA